MQAAPGVTLWWPEPARGSGGRCFPQKRDPKSQDIVGRLWGVYGAWIELNLASQWQKPGGRRRQMQAAPGVTLWWPEPAGGSGRPIVSPKGVPCSLKTSWGDSGAFMVRGLSSIWPCSGRNRVGEGGKSRQSRG